MIYTTNAIEALNRQLRKAIKTKGQFPNEEAARKLIYLAITNAVPQWTRTRGWTKALLAFSRSTSETDYPTNRLHRNAEALDRKPPVSPSGSRVMQGASSDVLTAGRQAAAYTRRCRSGRESGTAPGRPVERERRSRAKQQPAVSAAFRSKRHCRPCAVTRWCSGALADDRERWKWASRAFGARRPELVESVREPETRQTTITLGQTFEFDLVSSAVKRVPRPAVQASLQASVGSATYDPQTRALTRATRTPRRAWSAPRRRLAS